MNEGKNDGADPDAIIEKLSSDIATAVDSYIKNIIVTIKPGIAVSVAGTAAAQTGTTISPGTS